MSQLSNRIAYAMINYANAFKDTPDNRELAEKELKEALRTAIDFVPVKIWLDPKVKAQIPEYAHYVANSKEDGFGGHATDACCDVVCTSIEKTDDGRIKCGTGIHVALEHRDSLTCRPNSRITKMGYVVANAPMTLDESYRGEFFIVFRPIVDNPTPIEIGDVIGQFEVPHHRQMCFETVENLEDLGITDRGDSGFGSTAKK
jgi:dUTP pyrophosphatase